MILIFPGIYQITRSAVRTFRRIKLSDKVDKHNSFDRRLVAIETKLDMKKEEERA